MACFDDNKTYLELLRVLISIVRRGYRVRGLIVVQLSFETVPLVFICVRVR